MKGREKEILFSIVFLILSYYIFTRKAFLSIRGSDLFYHVLFIILSLFIGISSIIDLRHLERKNMKSKISLLFCFVSSLIFIGANIYYLLA